MVKQKKQPVTENTSVKEGVFSFSGSRIWVSIPVYQYENPSGHVTTESRCPIAITTMKSNLD